MTKFLKALLLVSIILLFIISTVTSLWMIFFAPGIGFNDYPIVAGLVAVAILAPGSFFFQIRKNRGEKVATTIELESTIDDDRGRDEMPSKKIPKILRLVNILFGLASVTVSIIFIQDIDEPYLQVLTFLFWGYPFLFIIARSLMPYLKNKQPEV